MEGNGEQTTAHNSISSQKHVTFCEANRVRILLPRDQHPENPQDDRLREVLISGGPEGA